MSKLVRCVDAFSVAWRAMPTENRDKILGFIRECHQGAKEVVGCVSPELFTAGKKLVTAAIQTSLMPFGPSVEDVVIEVMGAVPELSPYVRQLMED